MLPMSLRFPSVITIRPCTMRMRDHFAQRDHSGRPELLEEGRLRFDAGHQIGDDIDDLGAKLCVGSGPCVGRIAC